MRGIYNKIPALKNHHLHNLKHKKPIKCLREAWYIYSKKIDIFIWIVIYVLYIYIYEYIYISHTVMWKIYIYVILFPQQWNTIQPLNLF